MRGSGPAGSGTRPERCSVARSSSSRGLSTADDSGHGLRYATVAHTGDAAIADAAQYALDEGPCPEAIALNHVTVLGADDLTGGPPAWPRFTDAAGHLGIRSAVSIGIPWTTFWTGPADPDRPPVGAINFYAATPYGFLTKEPEAISLGIHVGSRLTGADPATLFDPASFAIDSD